MERVIEKETDGNYRLVLSSGGVKEEIDLLSDTKDEAVAEANRNAQNEASAWITGGDWGIDGALVEIRWAVVDGDEDEVDYGFVTVEIGPDHEALIREAVSAWDEPDGFCGLDPDVHDWTSEGEGGLEENPGIWATGGTSMVSVSHCRRCGLRRVEYRTGSLPNPGEHDTVKYRMLDADEIAKMRKIGAMD